jgi:O-antigen/teichoic acid export membrane protein
MMRGILEGAREFGWLGAARMSFIAAQAAGYFAFWAFGALTLEVALIVITIAQIIGLILMFAAVLRKLRPRLSWSFRVLKEELNYGLRSYPGIVTEFTIMRLDQMMLTGMASSSVIGLYTIAVALAEITATLASSVADALMPEVAASESKEKSTLLLGKSLRLTVYAHLLVLIPLWFAAPYILTFVYGAEFGAAAWTLRVLLVASIVLSAGMIVISGLNGFGHPGLSTIAKLASAVTTIVALVYLLPVWGIMGAALASLIGYAVMLVVALVSVRKTRGAEFWKTLRPRKQDVSLTKLKRMFRLELTQPPREVES